MDNNSIAYIELFGVTLSGARRPDQGLYWTDLKGWWGLPDLRGETDSIPGSHGRFPRVEHLRDSRAITLTGHILTKSGSSFMAARDRLEAALSASYGPMTVVTNTYGSWERMVEVDTLDIDPDYGKEYTKFTVDMVALDPRRYGPTQMLGPVGLPVTEGGVRLPQRMPWNFGSVTPESRLVITNTGSIPINPLIRISGGFEVVSVYDVTAGRRLRLEWPVTQGYEVIFDSSSRRAVASGSEVTRWLTKRQWFEIQPGDTHEFRFEVVDGTGNPQMWGEYREGAW